MFAAPALVAIRPATPRMHFLVTVLMDIRVIVMPKVPAAFAMAVRALPGRHGHAERTEAAFWTGDVYGSHVVSHVPETHRLYPHGVAPIQPIKGALYQSAASASAAP
jgi:hypothetical protein